MWRVWGAGMESQILGVGEAPSPELWQHARSQARAHENLGNLQLVSLPPALFFFGIRMKQAGCTYLGRFKKKVPVVGWVKAAGCTLKGNPQKGCGEDLGKAPSILASRGGF